MAQPNTGDSINRGKLNLKFVAVIIATTLALTVFYVGTLLLAGASAGATDPLVTGPAGPVAPAKTCRTVSPQTFNKRLKVLDRLTGYRHKKSARRVCKARLRKLNARIRTRKRQLARIPAIAIPQAFRDAGIAWRTAEAMRVARCESSFNRFATNGQYAGLFQLSSAHQSRMKGSPFNAYDNSRHAANTVRADGGWGQWECKP